MIINHSEALEYMITMSYLLEDPRKREEDTIEEVISNVDQQIISDFYSGNYSEFELASDKHSLLWDLTELVADQLEL
jgi:hypothetical protein